MVSGSQGDSGHKPSTARQKPFARSTATDGVADKPRAAAVAEKAGAAVKDRASSISDTVGSMFARKAHKGTPQLKRTGETKTEVSYVASKLRGAPKIGLLDYLDTKMMHAEVHQFEQNCRASPSPSVHTATHERPRPAISTHNSVIVDS